MSLRTKRALAAALKNAMERKPLSKVTVSELVTACNINRNTFYYHFKDIYELLKWMLEQEAIEVVKKIDLLVNADEALRFIMDYVESNKHIINCAYDSMGHDEMKRFLYSDFIGIAKNVIEEAEWEMGISVDSGFKEFLANFFTEAFAGTLLSWIKNKDIRDRGQVLHDLLLTLRTAIPQVLRAKAAEK